MDESFKAVSAKIDKAYEKFGVEKFGEKGWRKSSTPPSVTRDPARAGSRRPRRKPWTPWSRPATASATA